MTITELAVQRRLIERIRQAMASWGHHNMAGCKVCITVNALITHIEKDPSGYGARVVDDVLISGPPAP